MPILVMGLDGDLQALVVRMLELSAWEPHVCATEAEAAELLAVKDVELKSENVLPEPFTRDELTAAIGSALRSDGRS